MKTKLLILVCIFGYSVASIASSPMIVVLGDSLSSAYGLSVDQGWVSLLQQRLQKKGYPHKVINASVAGDTTSNGLSRLNPLLESHRPEIVFVELGGNDGLRAQPPALVRKNLQTIIEESGKSGASVILAGIRLPPNYGPAYVEKFEQIYPTLAKEYDIALVPFFMDGVATSPQLMQTDGVHPNADAQPRLLENVWPYLVPLLD